MVLGVAVLLVIVENCWSIRIEGKRMLFKIKHDTGSKTLESIPFMDFAELGKIEKDLETLLAVNLLDVLFEDAPLMAIFQERPLQAEADLYALDRAGDLVIFELKRGLANADAMLQALRYGQIAGLWTYDQLETKYRAYSKGERRLTDASYLPESRSSFSATFTTMAFDRTKMRSLWRETLRMMSWWMRLTTVCMRLAGTPFSNFLHSRTTATAIRHRSKGYSLIRIAAHWSFGS
jgi:hypothetical protein